MPDNFPRASGILLHPTSLPGDFGIGDIGDGAYRFVDFLNLKDMPQEKTTSVQLAIFQNFKDVLLKCVILPALPQSL